MGNVKRGSVAYLLALLAACTAAPAPQMAMDRVNREFRGHDVTEFFISYGSPAGSQAAEGGKTYRWLSLEPRGASSPASVLTYPGGHFGDIASGNGEMISGYCEVSILTDAQEKIKKITLLYDSIGKFSGSRCAEIFGAPPP